MYKPTGPYRNTGVFRRRSRNEFLLRKRLSRKPQTTTAPTPPVVTAFNEFYYKVLLSAGDL